METNNNSSVKNYQSEEIIKLMYEESFQKKSNKLNIMKLSGGMKNAVYLIDDDGNKVVLKIAPKDESKMITVDRNILWWESEMLKKMETIDFPSPRLLRYSDTSNICKEPYFFMSYIPGNNFLQCKEKLTSKEIEKIEYQIGFFSSKICMLKGNEFFLPSQPEKRFNDNFEFVLNLFQLLLNDASTKNMDLGKNMYERIINVISSNKENLNNITNLCLSHTDIWDGNVLVNEGNISGIVDFTDLYYCDELMTFYFHTIDGKMSSHFLKGFNKSSLNSSELNRIEIYRMYVILKMIVDCELKQYGKFDWMYENLNFRIASLEHPKVYQKAGDKYGK